MQAVASGADDERGLRRDEAWAKGLERTLEWTRCRPHAMMGMNVSLRWTRAAVCSGLTCARAGEGDGADDGDEVKLAEEWNGD